MSLARRYKIALLAVLGVVIAVGLVFPSPLRSAARLGLHAAQGTLRPVPAGERVALADGRVADLYRADPERLLVVWVHGSAARGRRGGISRLLANELRARGLSVLAVDLRGFGEAPDPPPDLRFEDDVVAWAEEAVERGWARPGRIAYAGHSLGAGVVLRAASVMPQPAAVVSMGGPATRDRFAEAPDARRRFARHRFRDMGITPDEASLASMERYLLGMDPGDWVNRGDLPPVLLIYGERDQNVDFLRPRIRAGPTLTLHVVPGAPHGFWIREVGERYVDWSAGPVAEVADRSAEWILRWSGSE